MFGWSVHISSTSTQLVVTDPISWLAIIVASMMTLWPLYAIATQSKRSTRKLVLFSILILVAFAFALDGTRVTLDKSAGTMNVREFAFYHWITWTEPLSDLDHAYLTTGSTTARITLQMRDGHTFSLSSNNQMGGKPAAVQAINDFIGVTQ